jgi:hypothetical protein
MTVYGSGSMTVYDSGGSMAVAVWQRWHPLGPPVPHGRQHPAHLRHLRPPRGPPAPLHDLEALLNVDALGRGGGIGSGSGRVGVVPFDRSHQCGSNGTS